MVDTGQLPEKSESVSMEEILNSIRQAIGETNGTQSDTSLNQSEFAPVGPGDVLELTHPIDSSAVPVPAATAATAATPPSSPVPPSPVPTPVFNTIPISGTMTGRVSNSLGNSISQGASSPILSDDSYESVAHAFKILSKAVEVKQAQEEHTGLAGQTVDVLMKEIMRPFIRDWLNQNLPLIVERLVAKEIERLTQSTLS
ncbi:MAG: hypothetical protein B7Y25_05820 [Alphaproteobacteria bacterium 16-39-46]|nr:MAG: hypothetical protein B7Y25_05820 [Alphaproteobacteria bacterium 16-39-46]OZA42517.1 MAG: hypothetical protein B7X84_05735 [Alphaproteobacteria bacterium 17-39-52]HQS84412.1 DUF2497 domain-containing protein [Alphaproteobacteria bacterium]HQS94221.1 DUF2497 domain-containing protein [Alphaproteobacteria bacterium]